MNIKLAAYSLRYSRSDNVQHGTLVCPANGATSVGTTVEIGKKKGTFEWEGRDFTVVWATGNKRGKKMIHRGWTLVDLRQYLAAIKEETDRIDALIQEASTMGM